LFLRNAFPRYFSPFPKEYADVDKLFFCEFCLNFYKTKDLLKRHLARCSLRSVAIARAQATRHAPVARRAHARRRHPPGNEIYRDGSVSMFEVLPAFHRVYLCDIFSRALIPQCIFVTF
jgi:histone acetyltransferase MYST1